MNKIENDLNEIIKYMVARNVEEYDRLIMPLYREALSKIKHPRFQKAIIWLDEKRVETKFCINFHRKPKIIVAYSGAPKPSKLDWDDHKLTKDNPAPFVIE